MHILFLSLTFIYCIYGESWDIVTDIKLSTDFNVEEFVQNVASGIDELTMSSTKLDEMKASTIYEEVLQAHSDTLFHTDAGMSGFTCPSLPTTYTPYLFCSGVVSYPFFLPNGMNATDLDKSARTLAQNFPQSILSSSCLSDVKRLLCATVYVPCVPKVIPGDLSTYMMVHNIPLPYIRPCMSLCSATTYLGTTCGGKLEALGLTFPCTTRTDPYFPSTLLYDSTSIPMSTLTNNTKPLVAICNDFSNPIKKTPLVANIAEPYIGSICTGFISSSNMIYLPDSKSIDSLLSPLLPSYVMQQIIEKKLITIEQQIPQYFPSECLYSRRRLMCATMFLTPYTITIPLSLPSLPSIGSLTVTIPSFPNHTICATYTTDCSNTMISKIPQLVMNCSLTTTIGTKIVKVYPTTEQVISSVTIHNKNYALSSPPYTPPNHNNLSVSMTKQLTTQCPYGYTPSHTTNTNTHNIGSIPILGTGCAALCPIATYTPIEYDFIYTQNAYNVYISLGFTILQVINVFVLRPSKQNVFLLGLILATVMYLIIQAIQLLFFPNRFEIICENDSTWHSLHAQETSSLAYYLCATTAFLGIYIILFTRWILIALSSEIWCRVVLGMKSITSARIYYMWIPLIIGILHGLCITVILDGGDIISPGASNRYCTWSFVSEQQQFYFMTLPGAIYFLIAFGLMAHSLYTCISTTLKAGRKQDNKKDKKEKSAWNKIWKSYSMLFMFMFVELIISPIYTFYFMIYLAYIRYIPMQQSMIDWTSCLFTHFINIEHEEYLQICGNTPSLRVTIVDILITYGLGYSTAILLFLITLNKDVKLFWYTLGIQIMKYTGMIQLLQYVMKKEELIMMKTFEWSHFYAQRRQRQQQIHSSQSHDSSTSVSMISSSSPSSPSSSMAATTTINMKHQQHRDSVLLMRNQVNLLSKKKPIIATISTNNTILTARSPDNSISSHQVVANNNNTTGHQANNSTNHLYGKFASLLAVTRAFSIVSSSSSNQMKVRSAKIVAVTAAATTDGNSLVNNEEEVHIDNENQLGIQQSQEAVAVAVVPKLLLEDAEMNVQFNPSSREKHISSSHNKESDDMLDDMEQQQSRENNKNHEKIELFATVPQQHDDDTEDDDEDEEEEEEELEVMDFDHV